MANMDSVFITQLYILNEIEKLGGSSMSLTTEIEELLEGKAQLEKILNSLMEEERGRTIKMVWLSKWFKEYWPVLLVVLMAVASVLIYSQWVLSTLPPHF